MGRLRGITIKLINKEKTGKDPFGSPVFSYVEQEIENVLVAPAGAQEIIDKLSLYGKRAEYNLAIPKGDTHNWEDAEVEFFGQRWRTFGAPIEGIDELIPGKWNKKVTVEKYG